MVLAWEEDIWEPCPYYWTVDLDECVIKQTVQAALKLPDPCDIRYSAKGKLNKFYTVTSGGNDLIARVTLPIIPTWKTLSEVATLQWVRDNTSLPVPTILAYQANRRNAIGFEWLAMTKMPGRGLDDKEASTWRRTRFAAKEEIVRQIAVFCAATFKHQLLGIGNLFPDSLSPQDDLVGVGTLRPVTRTVQDQQAGRSLSFSSSVSRSTIRVQRIVSEESLSEDPADNENVLMGRYDTSKDWLLARLAVAENKARRRLLAARKAAEDDDDYDETEVNDEDLDDNSALHNCDIQKHLRTLEIISKLRNLLDNFFPPTQAPGHPKPTMIYREDIYGTYWDDFKEYELTQLRKLFLGEMMRLEHGWVEIYEAEASKRKKDFDLAVACCDDGLEVKTIRCWRKDVEERNEDALGLRERMNADELY
ncbi:hypothetical protein B0H66DRAFT_630265 [Apodospora peruviana]|uniref:Aminoglycoside phosphotransferase domain-containing protein n=1 Tax=Apodospora peruviana TaxID=516989 RepID=A0AAE0HW25_9PEZI|nr:hypothetical protein B0H66DRAFT_630265 [Apodospora peruviana]